MSTATITPAYLTVRLAAEYTSLSPKTIRRLLDSGKLTAHRPTPGRVLISRAELESKIRAAANGRGRRRQK